MTEPLNQESKDAAGANGAPAGSAALASGSAAALRRPSRHRLSSAPLELVAPSDDVAAYCSIDSADPRCR